MTEHMRAAIGIACQIIVVIVFLNFQVRAFQAMLVSGVPRWVVFVADWLGMTCFAVTIIAEGWNVAIYLFGGFYGIFLYDRGKKLLALANEIRQQKKGDQNV